MNPTIEFANQEFVLDPSGALFWPTKKSVILSDVHLGKVAHFRKHGTALPLKAQEENYKRLEQLFDRYRPEQWLILGDLFHAEWNQEWVLFEAFVGKHPCAYQLIIGNHDIIDLERFRALDIEVLESTSIEGITFAHYPEHESANYRISGHLHPSIRLQLGPSEKRSLKCFYIKNKQLVLPAFGYFTGTSRIKRAEVDTVYVIAEDHVIAI